VFGIYKSINVWRRYEQKTMFTLSFRVTLTFDLYISNMLH